MRLNYFRCLISTLAISLFFQIPGFLSAQQAGPGAGPGPGAGVAQTTLTTFETDDFSGSGICAMCHSGLDRRGNQRRVERRPLAIHHDGQRRQGPPVAGQDQLGGGSKSAREKYHRRQMQPMPHGHGPLPADYRRPDGARRGYCPWFSRPRSLPSRGCDGWGLLHTLPPDSTVQIGHTAELYREVCDRHLDLSSEPADLRALSESVRKLDAAGLRLQPHLRGPDRRFGALRQLPHAVHAGPGCKRGTCPDPGDGSGGIRRVSRADHLPGVGA